MVLFHSNLPRMSNNRSRVFPRTWCDAGELFFAISQKSPNQRGFLTHSSVFSKVCDHHLISIWMKPFSFFFSFFRFVSARVSTTFSFSFRWTLLSRTMVDCEWGARGLGLHLATKKKTKCVSWRRGNSSYGLLLADGMARSSRCLSVLIKLVDVVFRLMKHTIKLAGRVWRSFL